MLTALDAEPEALDSEEQAFVAKIRKHGWIRTSVSGDDEGPGFSFTTGIFVATNQPELIIFSMKAEVAHDIFWDLFQSAKRGSDLPVGRRTDAAFANLPAYAFRVARKYYPDHLGWSSWFYSGDKFECLQIVWPDRDGNFPWEAKFNKEFTADQPDLTELGWANEVAD